MPQYSVVDSNGDNNVRAVHAFLDLRISPRPQYIRATATISLFIDYEYNYSVPGGNRKSKTRHCLIRAQFAKFFSYQPLRLYGTCWELTVLKLPVSVQNVPVTITYCSHQTNLNLILCDCM